MLTIANYDKFISIHKLLGIIYQPLKSIIIFCTCHQYRYYLKTNICRWQSMCWMHLIKMLHKSLNLYCRLIRQYDIFLYSISGASWHFCGMLNDTAFNIDVFLVWREKCFSSFFAANAWAVYNYIKNIYLQWMNYK